MKWIIVAAYLVLVASVIYFHFNEFRQAKKDTAKKAKAEEDARIKYIKGREKFKKEMEDKEREFEMELAEEDARFELLQAKSKAIKRRKILLKIMAKQPTS